MVEIEDVSSERLLQVVNKSSSSFPDLFSFMPSSSISTTLQISKDVTLKNNNIKVFNMNEMLNIYLSLVRFLFIPPPD